MEFTTKQQKVLSSTAREVLSYGGRGSGKSAALMAAPLYYIHEPDFVCVIIRKNSIDLKSFLDEATPFFEQFGGKAFGKPREFRFPSGAKIYSSHLDGEAGFEKIRGFNASMILLEEASQIEVEHLYLKVLSSLRSTNLNITPQIFLTSNTDGPGAKWIYERFVKDRDNSIEFNINGSSRISHFSNIYDNPYLTQDKEYVSYLENLEGELKDQWLNGKFVFGAKEGAVFANQLKPYEKNIKEFEIDINYPVSTVWDLGISDDTTIIFYQTIDEVTYIIHSYSNNGEGLHFYINYLQEFKSKNYIQYKDHWLPHDIEQRELTTGTSRIVTMRKMGLYPKVTPKLTIQEGIQKARQMIPYLRFRKGHTDDLVEALNAYHYDFDEVKGVLSSKPVHDRSSHYADAFRYMGVNFRQRQIQQIQNYSANQDWSPLS
jgi:hypothetical protein